MHGFFCHPKLQVHAVISQQLGSTQDGHTPHLWKSLWPTCRSVVAGEALVLYDLSLRNNTGPPQTMSAWLLYHHQNISDN